jgi:hypothetical protein
LGDALGRRRDERRVRKASQTVILSLKFFQRKLKK